MIAVCQIRADPHYRREAFITGLQAAGYELAELNWQRMPRPDDVLVIWNRYTHYGEMANRWEAAGGTVLVCENGYCGRDFAGRQYYAIAIGAHNGAGHWPQGDGSRWAILGIELKPWRSSGDYILVCLQRGIGQAQYAQPSHWPARIIEQLKSLTSRPIKVRAHPGGQAPRVPLADDLAEAWAVVTWASNCATQALIEGVPVFRCGPHIVTAPATRTDLEAIETPKETERLAAFQRLAWAQWSVEEIARGEPFEHLRDLARHEPHHLCGVR